MRTAAKRSIVRQAWLELELADRLALVEVELYRAGVELDRYYAELDAWLEAEYRRELRLAEAERSRRVLEA